MRFLEEFHTFWTLVFQRNAWFDSGFMLMRQTMEAGFACDITPRAVFPSVVVRPMKLGIMAGIPSRIFMCLAAGHVKGWSCW